MVIQLPNNTQRNVIISKDAVHEEEMMVSNFVKLTWNDATRYALPVGSYIVYGGVKYRLFDEYQPDASGERTYKYAPQFEHPTMWLKHIPFLRIELDGTKRSEWSFSGYVSDLGAYLLNFLVTWGTDVDTEFGTDFNPSAFVSNHVQYSGGIGDMIINISFSAVDVWSALTQIAGQLDCEFHVDLAANKLYIGTIATGTGETLTVGENVGVPSISRNKEAYCNRYVVHGGTRNLTQQGADGTNYQSTNRLTLPDNFTDSVINLKASNKPEGISQADWNAIKADQNEPSITGELVMDDIYPQVKFYLYDLKQRLRKRLLENGTESSETYATWYTKLAIRNGDNFTTYKMQDSVIATVVSKGTNSYGQQYIVLNMAFGSGSQFTGGRLRPAPGFAEMEFGLYWVEISDGTNKELAQVSPYGDGTLTKCIYQDSSLIWQNATTGTEITFIGGIDITKAPKNNIHSDRIAGVTLQCSFLPNYATGALDSPLTGRTFDIVTFNHSGTEHDNEDVDAQGQPSQGMAFDDETFRIEPVDENTLIIPQKSSQTLYPRANATANVVNNIVSLIGVKAPDTAIGVARTELLAAAIAAIKRKRLDNNTYTVKSYPQVFKSGNTSLSVGQAVTLINGTYTLATHVRKLVTRLDFPEIVEITVGNEKHKGPISTLKEQVSTVVYYGGGGVSAPVGGGSQSETPETTQMAERLVDNTPHTIWGQKYWNDGKPENVAGSLEDVDDIYMSGTITFNDNSMIFEDASRRLNLVGYTGILARQNLYLASGFAIKTVDGNENGLDLLAYKTASQQAPVNGQGVNHWFVGSQVVQGVLRSNDPLVRYDGTDSFTIWDSSNLTPSDYLQRTGGTIKGELKIAVVTEDIYGGITTHKSDNDEYLYLWGNDGVLIDGLSVRKNSAIVPIENVFLSLAGGTMEPGATITLQEIVNNIPVQTLVASQRWVNAQGFLTSAALSGYLPLSGGALTDDLSVDGNLSVTGTVEADSFITSDLKKLATEDWVEEQEYQTAAIETVYCYGNALTVTNKSVSIPLAGTNTPGVIQVGDGLTSNEDHLEVDTSIIASKDWVNKGYSNGRTTKYVEFPDYSWFNSNNYYSGYGGEDYFKALLKWCVAQIPTWRQNGEISASELNNASLCLTLIGSARPNGSGTAIINLYAASGAWSGEDDMDGMPKYASGVYFAPGTSEFVWHFRSWTVQANSAPVWYFSTFDFSSIDADRLDGHHASDFLLLSGGGLTGNLAITDAELKVSNGNGGWVHQMVHTASGASESTYKFYTSQNAQNSTPVTGYEFDKDVKVKKLIADEVQADNINAGLDIIIDDASVSGKTGRFYVDNGSLYYQYDNGTPMKIV